MSHRRSLDDACDVFLSRSPIHAPPIDHRAVSEFSHYAPSLCGHSLRSAPYFLLPRPLECSDSASSASKRPLPLPGSAGMGLPKLMRSASGRRHVPRPCNPFILFRCDVVHQRKVQPRSEADDTNVSRVAGELWREMTSEEKQPWVDLAAWEKARHALLYPDYKYAPAQGGSKGKKAKNENHPLEERPARQVSRMGAPPSSDHHRARRQPEPSRPYPQSLPRRRSSSCPPVGAVPVPVPSALDGWTPALVSQDDMRRRPSRTVMYQSVTSQPIVEQTPPMPAGHRPPFPLQGFDPLGSPHTDPWHLGVAYPIPDLSLSSGSHEASIPPFTENKPTFSPDGSIPELTLDELMRMERLTLGTFTDPFSSPTTIPVDNDSAYAFSTCISPLDCAGYSSGSSSSASLSSG